MEPNHTYIPSPDYASSLKFDFLETYSLQRGEEFYKTKEIEEAEYERLERRLEKKGLLDEAENNRFKYLRKLHGFTQFLIDTDGEFHPSAEKINQFSVADQEVSQLIKILQTVVLDIPSWMCAPIYRDAIVFYNSNGGIVSVLNVCLSCENMETKMFDHINADVKTYNKLKDYFISIGHKIEQDDPVTNRVGGPAVN